MNGCTDNIYYFYESYTLLAKEPFRNNSTLVPPRIETN